MELKANLFCCKNVDTRVYERLLKQLMKMHIMKHWCVDFQMFYVIIKLPFNSSLTNSFKCFNMHHIIWKPIDILSRKSSCIFTHHRGRQQVLWTIKFFKLLFGVPPLESGESLFYLYWDICRAREKVKCKRNGFDFATWLKLKVITR